jgi:hypothetical protein
LEGGNSILEVRISINELVIDGLGNLDQENIRSALKSELGRLIKEQGLPNAAYSRNREIRYVKSKFALESRKYSEEKDEYAIGREIAVAIHQI